MQDKGQSKNTTVKDTSKLEQLLKEEENIKERGRIFRMDIRNLNEIHYKRFEILIDYVSKYDNGEGLLLKRKDVLNIVGINLVWQGYP